MNSSIPETEKNKTGEAEAELEEKTAEAAEEAEKAKEAAKQACEAEKAAEPKASPEAGEAEKPDKPEAETAGSKEPEGWEDPEKACPGEPDKAAEEKSEAKKAEEDLNTKYLRLAADFQNFRRRTEKDKSDIYAFANEKIITDALTVLDNFERAMASAPEGDSFAEGMNLIFKQFSEMLAKYGLKEIEALGKPFDPQFHNAVQRMAQEGAETDTVITVLQKGYILNGKVIRPSMVIVAE